jgi:hypothetical protein
MTEAGTVGPGGPAAVARERPAGLCAGPAHMIVYGNPALRAAFGDVSVGLPAREGILGLPSEAFTLLDAVYQGGRPLARWIQRGDEEWRLTAAPRKDPENGEIYGVAFHLRERSDLPVLRDEDPLR